MTWSTFIDAQPFQVGSFLEYKNEEEQEGFSRLAELITHSMVTNHTDAGIFLTSLNSVVKITCILPVQH